MDKDDKLKLEARKETIKRLFRIGKGVVFICYHDKNCPMNNDVMRIDFETVTVSGSNQMHLLLDFNWYYGDVKHWDSGVGIKTVYSKRAMSKLIDEYLSKDYYVEFHCPTWAVCDTTDCDECEIEYYNKMSKPSLEDAKRANLITNK